ncbi:MAG TPA: SDR family NAD(P)-dependent oxidoreductase [Bacillota bacterium]
MKAYRSLVDVIIARSTLKDRGVTFIEGDNDEVFLSYQELFNKAIHLLGYLQAKGVKPTEEVVFQIEDNSSFICLFYACLLGGFIPVPVTVGKNDEHRRKLLKILNILKSPWLIVDQKALMINKNFKYEEMEECRIQEVERKTILYEEMSQMTPGEIITDCKENDIAFIQFSSGSTGDPKGVILTHKNLCVNIRAIIKALRIKLRDTSLSWMPLTHDMGLIVAHLSNMYAGINQYIMPTTLFIRQPTLWLKKAHEHKATLLYSPNFGYKHFLSFFKPDSVSDLDLSQVRSILNGAEPISVELCNEFLDVLGKYGLKREAMLPVYGLAEGTVGVTSSLENEVFKFIRLDRNYLGVGQAIREVTDDDEKGVAFVDVGYPINDCYIRICDENNNLLGDGKIGYIQIAGGNVTRGYYNNETATRQAITDDGWLNTGDLGFMRDGRLVITGRAKEIIIFNGQNIYPHDLERVAEGVEGMELGKVVACGVFDQERQSEEILLFVLFKKSITDFVPLAIRLKRHISQKMGLQIRHVIPVKKIPKTTSGKVQRYKLSAEYSAGRFTDVVRALEESIGDELKKNSMCTARNQVEQELITIFQRVFNIDEIEIDDNLADLAGNSLGIVRAYNEIERVYPGKVALANLFAYPTVSKLAEFISGKSVQTNTIPAVSCQEDLPVKEIAIIGIGLKMPMGDTIDEYWRSIAYGVDSVADFPKERREDTDRYVFYHSGETDFQYRNGAYLEEIDQFDYGFFGLNPREAQLMSPAQRIFLQTVWKTIEDAGYGGGKLLGSNTGVYVGLIGDLEGYKYKEIIREVVPDWFSMSIIGNLSAIIPGRISYLLGLKGPSMLIDTACSSSLTAVHLACRALRNRDCDLAIAGTVRINLLPIDKEAYKIGIESSDGLTRTFDNEADGSGIGEGVIAVLLKPLQKALTDNDHIYAVIKGSAVNQDGSSMGITAPNPMAQTEVIIQAWQDADIEPETITYIETHGTGTKLGDPIEIDGLKEAFGRYTDRKQFCAISSVKSNIGHLYEGSGLAGLVKGALSLKHKKLPPSLHFNRPNRRISFENSPVYINTRLRRWENNGRPRRCGISSFGLSGTNCHVVLEEAPESLSEAGVKCSDLNVFTLSAKSPEALEQLIDDYVEFLAKDNLPSLQNICYTANTGRGHYNYRLALILPDSKSLKEKLQELSRADLAGANYSWLFYGVHSLKSGDLPEENRYRITGAEKLEFTKAAELELEKFISSGKRNRRILEKICRLYVKGADLQWEELYKNENLMKVSLPTYTFANRRCWIEIPAVKSESASFKEKQLFYGIKWRPEKLAVSHNNAEFNTVLMLRGKNGIGEELSRRLKEDGKQVIEAFIGEKFERIAQNTYEIKISQDDFGKLLADIQVNGALKVVHLLTLDEMDEIDTVDKLAETQRRGVYSLLYFTKAFLEGRFAYNVDLLLVSRYFNEVTGEESRLMPENASLSGLGKVIGQEYPEMTVKCIDLDEDTGTEAIMAELNIATLHNYLAVYRKGMRFIEEFDYVEVNNIPNRETPIKEGGVYLITGGTSGIGLEVARYLAAKNTVKLALIARTKIPERTLWADYLSNGKDPALRAKIKALMDLESQGAQVLYYSADVARFDEMKTIIEDVRIKWGEINGVVHSAGIAGNAFLYRKDQKAFDEVLQTKIWGTWILDRLTFQDELDFFILFSSGISLIGEPGQGDYVAANSYIDSFTAYRNKLGKRTQVINWAIWEETGMGINNDLNFVITVFKTLPTAQGISAFARILNKDIQRVFVGEMNEEGDYSILSDSPYIKLSERLEKIVTKKRQSTLRKQKTMKRSQGELKLQGREDQTYSEIEQTVAQLFSDSLGLTEINIHDSFFELGGNSIQLTRLHAKLNQVYPGVLKTADLFTYTSVYRLSQYVMNSLMKNRAAQKSVNQKSMKIESKVSDLIKGMESGELTMEQVVSSLSNS